MAWEAKSLPATKVYRLLQVGALVLSGSVFLLIVTLPVKTDLQVHAEIVRIMIRESIPPGNFLYYLAVALLSGFSLDLQVLCYSSCAVLALSVLFKFSVSKRIVFSELDGSGFNEQELQLGGRIVGLLIILFCLSLFAHNYPVFSRRLYLGQFPPNVWHNSTTIFLMPFALLLFHKAYVFLRDGEMKLLPHLLILCVINILIKPSFCFVFLIVFPVFALRRFGMSNKSLAAVLLACFVGMLILLQYVYIYKYATIFDLYAGRGPSGVKIDFLKVWRSFSQNKLLSLLASLIFPLVSLAFYYKSLIASLLYRYTVASFVVALMIFMVLAETGGREFHGNFGWQVIISNFLLFLVTLTEIARRHLFSPLVTNRFKCAFGALLGHYGFGLVYLAKLVILRSYS